MGDEGRKLFVGRLPDDITEDEIRMIFNTYGRVEGVKILDKGSQKAAFVTYDSQQGADVAVQVLNDVYRFRTDARDPIHVSHARTGGSGGGRSGGAAPNAHSDYAPPGGYGGYSPSPGYGYPSGSYPVQSYDQGAAYGRHDAGGGGAGGSKVYVANLPDDITKDALDYVFRSYGRLTDVHILGGRSKSGRAAAFVCYSDPEEARKCILAMQSGYEIRPGQGDIQVKYASDQRPPNSGPRSKPF